MSQHIYQNYGNPRYEDIRFPQVYSEAEGNFNIVKTGKLISGGGIKYLACVPTATRGKSKNKLTKTWETQSGFVSINNYEGFNRTLTNDRGMCLIAIPKKTIFPQWDYNITDNWWYNKNNVSTYIGYLYLLLTNQGSRVDFKFEEKTTKITRIYSDGKQTEDSVKENNTTYTNIEYFPNGNKTLKTFLTKTESGDGQDITDSYNITNYDNSYESISYNTVDEEIVNNIVENYTNILEAKLPSNLIPKCHPVNFGNMYNYLYTDKRVYNKIWTTLPIFGYDQIEDITNYFLNGDKGNALNKDDIELLELDWSTDWKLYVDGKNPSLKLLWESKKLEEYLENQQLNVNKLTYQDIKIEVSQNDKNGNRVIIDYIPYTSSYYKTSYDELAKKFDADSYDKFLSEIFGSLTGMGNIPFYFRLMYKNLYSSLCYCIVPYSEAPTNYGLVSDSFEDNRPKKDNSTVTVIYGSDDSEDDGYKDRTEADDLPEKGTDGTEGQNTSGLLSTVYVMTETRLKQLASFLWSDDFFQNIKLLNNSPIENIVSCKVMPCSASGTDSPIKLGNVSTGVNGDKTDSSMRVQIGSLSIPKYYNSFLDYAPYTKLTIFLPFIGFKELDTNVFMGKTLKLYYVFDFITGAVKAQIFANDIYCMSFDATAGIDIPITASNRAQVEASYIKSALSVGGSIASGNPLVAVGGLLESANTQYHYNTQGTFSPSCGFHDTRLAYVIYDRPTAQYPTTYNHNCGKPCLLSRNLGSVSGYTEVDKGIELSGIPCTESERKEILDLITTGIFL